MISLAVFLGNPGAEYARNRHNAGRLLAEKLPFYSDIDWKKKFKGHYGSLKQEGFLHHFLVPGTYMNLSGISVQAAAKFFSIPPAGIIVAHDELELPLGYISLKFGGGLGGHNGLRSVKECLGTAEFWRLRVGIGRPPGRLPGEGGPPVKGIHDGGEGHIAQWVLSNFNPGEAELVNAVMEEGAGLLARTLLEEPGDLLSGFKKKKVTLAPITELLF